ncbi:hypothetical protein BDY21DRAFT_363985 [Lineolata rhizophorae]|uniref:EthD domain-containing protein n=1 Tax=Lineolata rhizophorae TaxID=578093 RepID=A0A6A6NZE0_9PEZI|nr:hypothetical protein BDY21DRAFT_363985 [Lineolata rhizophorae]
MGPPGLFYVLSKPTHPSLSEQTWNTWYTSEHMRDMVSIGLADLAIRYRNTNPSASWPYLAVYRLPDAAKLQDPAVMGAMAETSDLLPAPWKEVMAMELRAYALVQRFEGQVERPGRARELITVAMEPAEGEDAERDFDEWYRKQHLDMLSMCDGYCRTTRYKKLDDSTPRYIALHEYESTAYPPKEQLKLVTGTEWSKKVIGTAKVFDRDVWEYVSEYSKEGVDQKL